MARKPAFGANRHSSSQQSGSWHWRTLDRARRGAVPYLFLLPALLLLTVVVLYPAATAVGLSFQRYVLTDPASRSFIGLANYARALADPDFASALARSGVWVVVNLLLQMLLGLGVALVLNANFPLRGFLRAVILIPWVTPSVVTALMWTFILDPSYGVLNDLLLRLGLTEQAIPFISQPDTAFVAVVIASVWFGVPFFAVMILAALQSIPQELYEAGAVDGASGVRSFWLITLPLIAPTIVTTALLRTLWLAQYIDIIFLMTGGGPARATTTVPVYTFILIRSQMNFGYSAALAMILALVLFILAWAYLRYLRRLGGTIR